MAAATTKIENSGIFWMNGGIFIFYLIILTLLLSAHSHMLYWKVLNFSNFNFSLLNCQCLKVISEEGRRLFYLIVHCLLS